MHTEYELAQTLHRDRLRDAEEHRRWRTLREEQKRRKAEARAAHRNGMVPQITTVRLAQNFRIQG